MTSRQAVTTGLVIALVLGAGVAVGGAADAPQVMFAQRHAGDVVVYQGSGSPSMVSQLPVTPWRDLDGRWHAADGVAFDHYYGRLGDEDLVFRSISLYEAGTLVPLANTGLSEAGLGQSGGVWGQVEDNVRRYTLYDGQARHPCGWIHSMQGAPLADHITAQGHCFDGPADLALLREDTWRDSPVRVYGIDQDEGGIEIWLRPDIPYPVRVVYVDESPYAVDLVSWQPGEAALVAPELPQDQLIAAPMSPAPSGLESLFADAPYPLSKALADAASDPLGRYAEFRGRHPDAVVVEAELHVNEVRQSWRVMVADEAGRMLMFVERDPTLPPLAVNLAPGNPVGVSVRAFEIRHGWHVSPDQWPGQMPSLEAAAEAWRSYTGRGGEITSWGVRAPACVGCGFSVAAGRLDADVKRDNAVMPPTSIAQHGSVFWLGGNRSLDHFIVTMDRTPLMHGAPPGPAEPTGSSGPWSPPGPLLTAGIGTLALLAGGLTWVGGAMWVSRTRRPGDHPVRSKLAALVKAQPGIHYQAIVKTTGLGNGQVEHHLRKLVARGDMVVARNNHYTCYFPAGATRQAVAAAGAVKSEGAKRIIEAIQSSPGVAVADVTQMTGLSPGTVSHHLKRLRDGGLVDSWRDGRTVRMRVAAC